jgi:hypothetical protein
VNNLTTKQLHNHSNFTFLLSISKLPNPKSIKQTQQILKFITASPAHSLTSSLPHPLCRTVSLSLSESAAAVSAHCPATPSTAEP